MDYKGTKLELNKKLIIYLVSIIVGVIVIIGLSVNQVFEDEFEKYISKSNEKEVKILMNSIESKYQNGIWDKDRVEEIGKNAIEDGRIVEVYDSSYNIIFSALEYDKTLCHSILDDIVDNMSDMNPNWIEEYKEEAYEIKDNNKVIGYVKIGSYGPFYYMDEEVSFLNKINALILFLGVVTVIITIVVIVIISNSISKPIQKVAGMAKSIGENKNINNIEYISNIKEVDNLILAINDLSDKLKEQEKLRKRLTTDISHELRTPLTSIQAHLEAMIDGIWEPTTERLESINEEAIRLTNLVNELNKLSSLDNEKSTLNLSEVNVSTLIRNIVYNLENRAREKNINIELNIEDVACILDKEKISQAIVNIISNAIRYTQNEGNINIISSTNQGVLMIKIIDTGIGISKEHLPYIFERFYRVDTSRSKKTGGIGVGLAITKSIIDLHKGEIEVISKEEEGCTFILKIPLIES